MFHFPQVGSLPQFPEYDILIRHISTAGGSKLEERGGQEGEAMTTRASFCFRACAYGLRVVILEVRMLKTK